MIDLKAATNDEIFDELSSRYHGIVVTSVKQENGREIRSCSFFGGCITAVGLCEYAKNYLLNYSQQNQLDDASDDANTVRYSS